MDTGLRTILIDAATQQVAADYGTQHLLGVLDDDAPATATSSHMSWYVEVLAEGIASPLCFEVRVTDTGDVVALELPDMSPLLMFLYPDPLPWSTDAE
jgi:hypothetical protein